MLINNKEYVYKYNYKNDEKARESFNELTEKTYGFNFREWYNKGHWQDKYIPYSLFNGEKAVANVSVNIMDTTVLGVKKRLIQIGTVMTDKEYRGKGLSKFLMEKVIEEWEDKCEFLYLFANDSVLNFYPKFGFKQCDEYQYSTSDFNKNNITYRRLNMDDSKDRKIFSDILNNDTYKAKVNQKENKDLLMFYCDGFLRNCVYYIEDYNTVAVCEYDEDILILHEIFLEKEISLKDIVNAVINKDTKKVVLGFTPRECEGFEKNILREEDTTLFIKGDVGEDFKKEGLMFPTLAHA